MKCEGQHLGRTVSQGGRAQKNQEGLESRLKASARHIMGDWTRRVIGGQIQWGLECQALKLGLESVPVGLVRK